LLPGNGFSVEAAAAALSIDVRAARRALDELVDMSLLEDRAGGDYRFHELVRVHAIDQALREDSEDDRAEAVRNVLHWYLYVANLANRVVMPARRVLAHNFGRQVPDFALPPGIDHHATAMAWLADRHTTLMAATHDAAKFGWAQLAYHLSDALQPLFILHKHQRSALEIGEVALRAAETWDNVAAETSARKRLGRTYAQLGHTDRARHHATELLRQARARHDRRAEASALKNLALLDAAGENPQRAVERFAQVIGILRVLDKRRGEGLARIELADVLVRLNDTEGAIAQLRQAQDILSAVNPPDPYNAARATSRLGQAHLRRRDFGLARQLLQEAVAVLAYHDAGQERGQAHRALAELSRQTGDDDGARRHDEAAARVLDADEPSPEADEG
jgi:tetratricopeptide (TPR) repeat protein